MEKVFLEQVLEIRFKPHSRVLDKRGEITNALTDEFFNHWNISQNSIELKSDENDRVKAFFGFRNAGLASSYPTPKEDFAKLAKEHIKKSWTYIPIQDIVRVGVNSTIVIPTDNFNDYFEKFRTKFFNLEKSRIEKFGGDLVDVALPLNFSNGANQFNTMSGPVVKTEIERFYKGFENEAPDFGVFCQTDYFTEEITSLNKQKDMLSFVDDGIEKAEKVIDALYSILDEKKS